ncbi:MAG TPA: hypothetical protein VMD30_07785 [Tepidisphaeraceae bacterium]|nr:hypothetical protein [Tepidisphaeraceae bacterium]
MATALCADRAVVSSASVLPREAGQSQTLVEKLASGFRQVIQAVRLYRSRCQTPRPAVLLSAPVDADDWALPSLSPFQFRLPPPLATL